MLSQSGYSWKLYPDRWRVRAVPDTCPGGSGAFRWSPRLGGSTDQVWEQLSPAKMRCVWTEMAHQCCGSVVTERQNTMCLLFLGALVIPYNCCHYCCCCWKLLELYDLIVIMMSIRGNRFLVIHLILPSLRNSFTSLSSNRGNWKLIFVIKIKTLLT